MSRLPTRVIRRETESASISSTTTMTRKQGKLVSKTMSTTSVSISKNFDPKSPPPVIERSRTQTNQQRNVPNGHTATSVSPVRRGSESQLSRSKVQLLTGSPVDEDADEDEVAKRQRLLQQRKSVRGSSPKPGSHAEKDEQVIAVIGNRTPSRSSDQRNGSRGPQTARRQQREVSVTRNVTPVTGTRSSPLTPGLTGRLRTRDQGSTNSAATTQQACTPTRAAGLETTRPIGERISARVDLESGRTSRGRSRAEDRDNDIIRISPTAASRIPHRKVTTMIACIALQCMPCFMMTIVVLSMVGLLLFPCPTRVMLLFLLSLTLHALISVSCFACREEEGDCLTALLLPHVMHGRRMMLMAMDELIGGHAVPPPV